MGFVNILHKYQKLVKLFEDIFGGKLVPISYFSGKKQYSEYVANNKRAIVIFTRYGDITPGPPNFPPEWVWEEKVRLVLILNVAKCAYICLVLQ